MPDAHNHYLMKIAWYPVLPESVQLMPSLLLVRGWYRQNKLIIFCVTLSHASVFAKMLFLYCVLTAWQQRCSSDDRDNRDDDMCGSPSWVHVGPVLPLQEGLF